MKKLIKSIGLFLAILAVVLSVTPLYTLALIPGFLALLCAGLLYYLKQKNGWSTKFIQYIAVLGVMALALSSYKMLFAANEVENVEAFEQKEEESVEDSMELLEDIEIDE
jgi:hypothetical protein